ncbi:hypothetical protein KC367_g9106 [Hortaea werneckii]|nr:hypothetical protein KC367_g9106 [Hortaea werneckii]
MGLLTLVEDRPTPSAVYNWRVYACAGVASFASCMIGYDSAFFGTTIALESFEEEFRFNEMSESHLNFIKANIVSIYQAGAFFGALFAYASAYWLGRKFSLILWSLVFLLGAGIMLGANGDRGLDLIYAGRVIAGIASKEPRFTAPFALCPVVGVSGDWVLGSVGRPGLGWVEDDVAGEPAKAGYDYSRDVDDAFASGEPVTPPSPVQASGKSGGKPAKKEKKKKEKKEKQPASGKKKTARTPKNKKKKKKEEEEEEEEEMEVEEETEEEEWEGEEEKENLSPAAMRKRKAAAEPSPAPPRQRRAPRQAATTAAKKIAEGAVVDPSA